MLLDSALVFIHDKQASHMYNRSFFMRKKSDTAASRVTKVVIGLGFITAALAPFGGAALAAWSTGSAALATSLGLGAAAPLAAAGAFGGFVLGVFAAPVIAIASIAVGLLAGATTRAIGSTLEWMAGGNKPASVQPKADVQQNLSIDITGTAFNGKKLGESFEAAKQERKVANQNKPQPKLHKLLRFGM